MPGTTLPSVPHYVAPPPTKEQLDWADLAIIDISKARTPEGRAELAPKLHDAMRTVGFVYVINHGMTQAQTDRIFDIADVPFSQVPEDEKRTRLARIAEEGSKLGYKMRQFWALENGVRDQSEQYSMHHAIYGQQDYPDALKPYLPELRAFTEHNHYNVLLPIAQMLALGLELPEDAFGKPHDFDADGHSHARFIKYFPRTQEEELKTKNVWVKGHTDAGTITILWSQPVSGLQILSPDGQWRWVRHVDNALVVNIGYAMEALTGGYYKATIHRVVQPPADQRGYHRLGAFYFGMVSDDARLVPVAESPVLQREGIVRPGETEPANAMTMGEWRRGRTMTYGIKETTKKEGNVEEQEVGGMVLKHYN